MATVRLRPGREKPVRNRHPWIFSGSIAHVEGSPKPGSIVEVRTGRGEFLARGHYSPRSQISVRILTWDEAEEINEGFWRRRLRRTIARRRALAQDPETSAYRLVYGESDGLPGLIVDRYGDWLVLQSLTVGIERCKGMLAELLVELLAARGVYERSDADVRAREGLASIRGCLLGEEPGGDVTIRENALRFGVDIAHGQKTGLYLDQRESRAKVANKCQGKEVLDAFCYTGGFAVHAAAQGAGRVTHLDTSGGALLAAAENMRLNGFQRDDDEYVQGDAFQVLRRFRRDGREFDVVILDPPKFAFSRAQVTPATRGYKDINMLGMQLLRPNGTLCTFSCSGLVSEDLFQKVLFGASIDVGREVRIVERLGQGSDHPVLLTFPQSAYLKGFICQVE